MQLIIRKRKIIRLGDQRIKGARLVIFAVVITRPAVFIQFGTKKLWLRQY